MAAKGAGGSEQMSFGFEGKSTGQKKKTVKKAKAKPAKKKGKTSKPKPKPVKKTVKVKKQAKSPRARMAKAATAESMAEKQRDISISEFFAKNRHLLGFDNPRKALLTTIKEAVDNALDACEEAHILPDLVINIKPLESNRFILYVRDNGPGIVKEQIPNIFARLLYGSKFHSLKMSRGQQGIGISAAGMYGLLTTGEPVQIVSRTNPKKKAHHYHVQIDTAKNKPEVVLDDECDFDLPTGTSVTITLEGKYQKGRQSVDEYISQTAMANPHSTIIYNSPDGKTYEYERQSDDLPFVPNEIKPHPYGVELGLMFKMARESEHKNLTAFLQKEFSRVSPRIAKQICDKANVSARAWTSTITLKQVEHIQKAISEIKIMSPSSDCIGPIGEEELLEGIKRVVDADFYASCSRGPSVYRGNPFLVEAALAYGGKSENDKNGDSDREPLMRIIRLANRVPLLYQQSACAVYKSVMDTNWRNYSMSQSRGALPTGNVILMVHIASVWVPFTSESKEAIAHYPEIIKEIHLAVQDCGRKLGMYLRKKKRIQAELNKRSYIETYLPYISEALRDILGLKKTQVDTVTSRLKIVLEKTRKM